MDSSLRTRAIVEGALMAALTAILALAGFYLPFLRFLTNLVWTIPIVIATVRHGLGIGIMSTVVAGFLIFILASPLEALFLVLQFGGLALLYGYAFNKGIKPGITLLAGTGVAIISFLLTFGVSLLISGLNQINFVDQLKETIEPTIEMYRSLGLFDKYGTSGLTEENMRQMLAGFINLLIVLFPALIVTYGIMAAFLNYIIGQKILFKIGIPVPQLPPFRNWQLPWWTVWGFIGGFGLSLAGSYWQIKTLTTIGSNIMMVYYPVLFVLGLSVIAYFYHHKLQRAFSYRLLFIFSVFFFFRYVSLLIPIVGLFDLVMNYRRLPGES